MQLAEIALAEKDYTLAQEYAERAWGYAQDNPLPFELLATIHRINGKKQEAKSFIERLLALDPLNHLAHYESYLLEPSRRHLQNFVSSIKNEFPNETYLELALHYLRIGLEENALELLQLSPSNPEILAWLAYLNRGKSREQSQGFLEKAASASPYLVFPFREESIPVFEWAVSQRPDCWKFRYYLGLIFWHKSRIEEARELFETLDEADYYPVFIARAYLNPDGKEKSYRDFKRANALSPEAWRTWHHLINFELANQLGKEAVHHSLAGLERFPENIYLQSDAVKALLASQEFQSASELLDRMNVLPYEGASEVHDLFARTHLHLALDHMLEGNWEIALKEIARSREYPVQLGTGRPFAPDERFQDYLEAICFEHLGQKEQARQKYLDIIKFSQKYPQGTYACFHVYALVKIGQKSQTDLLKETPRLPEEFRPQLEKLL